MRGSGWWLAACAAVLGCVSVTKADVGMLGKSGIAGTKVEAAAVRELVTRLSFERHRRNPRQVERARDEIVRELEAAHWAVQREPFTIQGVAGVNLRARRPGLDSRARTWIVGAHYDTVEGSPGADDNASGVAGLIAIARVLGASRFRDTVELVAFDLEESMHGGSEVLAQKMAAEREPVAGMISLEMLGYRSTEPGSQRAPAKLLAALPGLKAELERRQRRGDFLAAITNAGDAAWVGQLASEGEALGAPIVVVPVHGPLLDEPALRRSDHAPFWDAGFAALVLTDTAEHRNARYHTASDTPDTLDYEFLAGAAAAVARTVAASAGPR